MTSRNDEANAVSLVDHSVLRRAVAEFAAQPGQQRCYDVLRSCMYGELLLDTTGSSALTGTPFAHGSELRIHGGSGPNGGKALFAFTRNEEIARRRPPGTATQSLVQSAVATLEFARSQGYAWLYIDPAGPTCALSATEIDFALRNPNNETLKKALADFSDGLIDRQAVLQVLRQDGPLLLGADDSVAGKVGIRVLEHDEGSSLLAFTSAPEVVAYNPADAVMALTTHQVLGRLREQGHRGIVINPARPHIAFSITELFGGDPDHAAGAH
ncbi:hypothetical protein BB737_01905 [Mycobacterium avium subsp. hominissuis]|uniref:SseB family protein n=1 Tax=Mycobacterium avium TaxID=1764 RepID=UPI000BB366E8|nr:SseB family protein [Mycobacterium avium]PBJ67475.1 hypothetical protein BB737_01905 [Mycobacterium avium subsp. hominissuis]